MSIDAARLRAEGVTVPTVDGEAVLRFDLLALSVIEEDSGSIAAGYDALRTARSEGLNGSLVSALGSWLRAGLAEPGKVPSAVDALARVELNPFDAYDAVIDAVAQAFPPQDAEGEAEADGATGRSTGPAGTTPPPSAGTDPMTSSGG